MPSQPVLLLLKVTITNISVNREAECLEENTGECSGEGSLKEM
jgi:hypothetical protein